MEPHRGSSGEFPTGLDNPALMQILDNADRSPELVQKQQERLPGLDTHEAALRRQLLAGWGWRNDKDDQIHAPLADHPNWRRIRLWSVDHLTAFRYTDEHHLLTAAITVETPHLRAPSSRQCMEAFESEGLMQLERRSIKLSGISEAEKRWRNSRRTAKKAGESLVVHSADGESRILLKRYEFSAAWAAYPAYDGGCLVYAMVALWGDHPDLARRVRDRWVREGFRRMDARTRAIPFRH